LRDPPITDCSSQNNEISGSRIGSELKPQGILNLLALHRHSGLNKGRVRNWYEWHCVCSLSSGLYRNGVKGGARCARTTVPFRRKKILQLKV
jgi:hypothetical protein